MLATMPSATARTPVPACMPCVTTCTAHAGPARTVCQHSRSPAFKPSARNSFTASARTVTKRQLVTAVRSEAQDGPQAGRGSYPDDPEKAAQLRAVAEKMDSFFANSDAGAFDAVADSNIVLHGDLLILDKDISGADTVKKTLQTYTGSYDYKHVDVAHGADIDGSSIFHFWLHQDLKKKDGGGDGDAQSLVDGTATKAAMWRYVVNDSGKISDIYFLTQLTPEEKLSMFTDPKLGTELKFNVMDFKGPTTEKDDNHQSSMLESAKIFSEIWETGKSRMADDILNKDFHEIAPIFGSEIKGRDNFKKSIDGLFSNYERTGGMSAFGVDPDSNKAFIHWESKGKIGGDGPEGVSLFGLNMLIFDSYGLIKTVVGFRQPLPNERAKYLKKVAQHA